MPKTGAGALILSLLLSGCGGDSVQGGSVQGGSVQGGSDPGGFACTLELRPGIAVTVLDETGAPAACGARAVITSGSYSESVEVPAFVGGGCPNNFTLSGAHERPGTYTVTVSKAGYRDFVQNNVVVVSDICHVITVPVTAQLAL